MAANVMVALRIADASGKERFERGGVFMAISWGQSRGQGGIDSVYPKVAGIGSGVRGRFEERYRCRKGRAES